MRRVVIVIVVLGAAGLAYLGTGWSARPRVVCAVRGEALSPPTGGGRWVVWLEGDEKDRRLVAAPRSGGRPRTVLSGAGLSGLAVSDETAYVTRAAGGRAELMKVSLRDGETKTVADLAEGADQIDCSGGWIVWRRSRAAGVPGVVFVAAAAPVTVVSGRPLAEGPARVLAVVSGEGGASRDDFDLLGVAGDRVYWVERGVTSGRTRIRRAPFAGGTLETVAEEQGWRSAALDGDVLLWAGPSREGGHAESFASVQRMDIGSADARVIADWLDARAAVMLSNDQAYAQERGGLWRLGRKRGEQRQLAAGPPGLTFAQVIGDEEFMVVGSAVVKRPLSMWAKIRSAAGR